MPLVLRAVPVPPGRIERPPVDAPDAPPLAGREAIVFGLMAASLARPSLIAQAAAPVLGAWILAGAGPQATLWILSALALANAGILALLWRSIRV